MTIAMSYEWKNEPNSALPQVSDGEMAEEITVRRITRLRRSPAGCKYLLSASATDTGNPNTTWQNTAEKSNWKLFKTMS